MATGAFSQGNYEGLVYQLYIPEGVSQNSTYPLVLFLHDASVCGDDPQRVLKERGAAVWATGAFQQKHPCFVLAPQFSNPPLVDDDWNVDPRVEVTKRLLDFVVSKYAVDQNRLYITGQSMGCMMSMVLNLRYPDLFAASFFVAGQWDEKAFSDGKLSDKHFWFLNSMGDAKAFPGMNQILIELERGGARIARQVWDAKAADEDLTKHAAALVETGANIIYTPFDITTVADGWHSSGVEHHFSTWKRAYDISSIHEWLFAQKGQKT